MTRHELQKMTVVKLREEALKYPELSGVHGMKKAELIDALAKVFGLPEEEKAPVKKKKAEVSKTSLKSQVKELKQKRAEAIQAKDSKALKLIRKKIKRAKRVLRELSVA